MLVYQRVPKKTMVWKIYFLSKNWRHFCSLCYYVKFRVWYSIRKVLQPNFSFPSLKKPMIAQRRRPMVIAPCGSPAKSASRPFRGVPWVNSLVLNIPLKRLGGGDSKIFGIFTPWNLGKMNPCLTCIFFRWVGWNHQLELEKYFPKKKKKFFFPQRCPLRKGSGFYQTSDKKTMIQAGCCGCGFPPKKRWVPPSQ